MDLLPIPPDAPKITPRVTDVTPRQPDGAAPSVTAAQVRRSVELALVRWERSAARSAQLGDDLDRYLTRCPATRRGALEQGLVAYGARVTLAGLRLLDEGRRAAAEERRTAQARLEAEEQAAVARLQAEQEALQARARAQGALDAVGRLLEELRGLRGDLEGLDSCLGPNRAAGDVEKQATAVGGQPCSLLGQSRCSGAMSSSTPCWSRQSSCIAPRYQPRLYLLPGGLAAGAAPSRAAVAARRALELDRAQRALVRAAKRWVLCWMPSRACAAPAGADLGPYLASSRKERRRQRPLYALGYLEHVAVGAAGAPQRLTAAGAAWLAERQRQEQRPVPPAPLRLAAAAA